MNFDVLDARMRLFETQNDVITAPETFIVMRLDGRNFTRLTKENLTLEKPFDTTMYGAMLDTTRHLMTNDELPESDEYSSFIKAVCERAFETAIL